MSEAKFYVIGNAFASPWLLNMEPKTLTEAKRAIAWQRQGQGQFDPPEYWQITEYEPSNGFVNAEGRSFIPGRSPYTAEAWAEFLSKHGD